MGHAHMKPRPRERLVGVWLLLGLGAFAAAAAAQPRAESPRQKSLYVNVVDKQGAPVKNIGPEAIIVREDGVAREVLKVEPATEPMQVAVLVDNSQAATRAIQFLRDALGPFADRLTAAKHRVSLITLADRPTIQVEATSDSSEFRKRGVERLFAQPGAGMYLLEGLIETTRGFTKNEVARPVVVAIITEGVEFGNQHYDQVLDGLKTSGTMFYTLLLTEGAEADPGSDETRNRNVVLDRGTRETGGVREILLSSMALGDALKKLADVLLNQYRVTYASPERLVPPERITVEAKDKELTARGTPVKSAPTR
jgi:hypothetical protein